MKVLITGRGTSGSFQIRAVQLGKAIGATVIPNASDADIRAHDLVILVKRPAPGLVERIHRAGKPLVWDVVDSFPQPEANKWTHHQCMAWLDGQIKALNPAAIVCATDEMRADCGLLTMRQRIWLPHHGRPGQDVNPIRENVRTVGYEGGVAYLSGWLKTIEGECACRGWRFQLAPKRLVDVDIVLALRTDAGYAPRSWKSGVKLANACATGTPFIGCREAGYLETASGGEYWADDAQALSTAFDRLSSYEARKRASSMLLRSAITLDSVAKQYSAWLCRVAENV